jgi:iron complex outermembrane receptor protein
VPTAVRRSFAQNLYHPVVFPRQPSPPRIIPNPNRTEDLGVYVFDRASLGDDRLAQDALHRCQPDQFLQGDAGHAFLWPDGQAGPLDQRLCQLYRGAGAGAYRTAGRHQCGRDLHAAVSRQKEAVVKIAPLAGLLLAGTYFNIARPRPI